MLSNIDQQYIDKEIEIYLKNKLKIELEYNTPIGLCDDNIKVTLKINGEIIDSSEKKINKTFF